MELTCPACSAPELEFDGEATFECAYCGTTLVASQINCPACGTLNAQGADECSNCGEPLSIVASVLDRQGSLGTPLWVRRLRSQVADLKQREQQASDERMAAFQQIDQRRIAAEAAAQARQRAKDSNIIFYGLVGVLVVILLAFVIAALV